MKKFNLLFITIVIVGLGIFYSCDKVDEDIVYDPELIGSWRAEYTYMDTINIEITDVEIISFNKDLTGTVNLFRKGEEPENPWPIIYSIQDDQITLTLLGWESTNTGTYSISGNKLYLDKGVDSIIYERSL